MSRDGSVTLTWADGDHTFRLGWGELEMLQEAVDLGPWVILDRLAMRQCRIEEIAHTLRCGLIGGGAAPADAVKLIDRYVKQRPPAENIAHAYAVLAIALQGVPDETPGAPGEPDAASEMAQTA